MDDTDLMHAEWEAWVAIVKMTKANNWINEADWSRAKKELLDSPGGRLIDAMRKWGDLLAALRVQQAKNGKDWTKGTVESLSQKESR